MNDFDLEIQKSIQSKLKLLDFKSEVNKAIYLIHSTLKKKNKILICGNGGSAADAQHLAAEFLIRLRPEVNREPYPVITLAQDTSTLTACGNDIGFENIFSRNLEALHKKGDLLIALSTSGNSKNIIKVLKTSKKLGLNSISLLGNKGGSAKGLSSLDLIVPEKNTARIQECHIFLGHFIFKSVENLLLRKKR